MKKIVAQEQNVWAQSASNWLIEKQKEYQAKSVYIPAGETPKLIYKDWEQQNYPLLKELRLIQIDDVLTGSKQNVFKQFFYDELPNYAEQIEYFENGETQADLGILGLGMNGHVAFHEPGINSNFYSGCVRLQNETIKNLELESNTWGKTYGAKSFYSCKALLLVVKGLKKKEILKTILYSAQAQNIPAYALLTHPDLTLLTDFEI